MSKLIEIIGPNLHHLNALIPELRGMHIRPADVVLFHVRELPLDGIRIPATHLVEQR